MKKDRKPRIEGYWWSKEEPQYPKPMPNLKSFKGKGELLRNLQSKQNIAIGERYRGYSDCRICGKRNGSVEYETAKWIWPEGLMHYIKEHNVKPSQDFIDWVMGKQG